MFLVEEQQQIQLMFSEVILRLGMVVSFFLIFLLANTSILFSSVLVLGRDFGLLGTLTVARLL